MSTRKFNADDNDVFLEVLLLNEGSTSLPKIKDHPSCKLCRRSLHEEYGILLKCKHIYHRNCILYHMLEESSYECPECVLNDSSSDDELEMPDDLESEGDNEHIEYMIDGNDCKICFEEIKEDQADCNECKSKYHKSCFNECKEKMNTQECPMCKYNKNLKLKDEIMKQNNIGSRDNFKFDFQEGKQEEFTTYTDDMPFDVGSMI